MKGHWKKTVNKFKYNSFYVFIGSLKLFNKCHCSDFDKSNTIKKMYFCVATQHEKKILQEKKKLTQDACMITTFTKISLT